MYGNNDILIGNSVPVFEYVKYHQSLVLVLLYTYV